MFLAISISISLAFLAVTYAWATSAFPWLAARPRGLAAALATLLIAQLAARWLVVRWHLAAAETLFTALTTAELTMGIAAIPLAVLRALSWAAGRRERARPAGDAAHAPAVTRRRAIEQIGGIALLGASGGTLGWGAARGRHMFELLEVPVRVARLPRALDGYVIAQISDLHAGVHLSEHDLSTGFSLVRKARPDLVVVTGDVVDIDPAYAPAIARRLADLPARDGVAAIPGNHDYYAGVDAVMAALRAAGVTTLVNDGRVVRPRDGGGFALLGVDDRFARRFGRPGPMLDRALAAVPPDLPRVLLSHQPQTVDDWAGDVDVQLSGHTHGGQINPGFRPLDLFYRYVAGAYEVGGTTLYVNRGFGTAGPPSRVGAPPEITRIVLVAA